MAEGVDWLPGDPQEFADWMINLNTYLPGTMAVKYGVGATTLNQLRADTDWAVYWALAKSQAEAQKIQVNDYYTTITREPAEPQPEEPTFTLPAGIPSAVPPGMRKRVRDLRSFIVGNKAVYSPADGELLRIVAVTSERAINPTFDFIVETRPNFTLRFTFQKQGYTAGRFEYQYIGESIWHFADKLNNSPGDIQIPPQTPGTAEQVFVRGILIEKNTPVGNYSSIKTALIAP